MRKTFFLRGTIVALMVCGATVVLQSLDAAETPPARSYLLADAPEKPRPYWLGLACEPVPESLRAHLKLPEAQGLLVKEVVSDSPAAKAGIAVNDVLLKAGAKPLANLNDLIEAVNAAKDGRLSIELIHDGQPKTVEATPTKRDEAIGLMRRPDDWDTMQRWLEQMYRNQTGQDDGRRGLRFTIPRPGAILPPGALVHPPLPGNMSISISKEGDRPLKIVVKRGEEQWEVTEKELDKLPSDIRRYVEQMSHWMVLGLGRGPEGIRGAIRFDDPIDEHFTPEALDREDMLPPKEWPRGSLENRLEKRLEAMERRMEKMTRAIDELLEGRPRAESADKPAEN